LAQRVIDSLETIRADAEGGKYGMSPVNTGVLAVWLLRNFQDRALWAALVAFLLDPQVTAADKTGAIDSLASDPSLMPDDVVSALSSGLSEIAAATPPLFGAGEELSGATLRLAIRLRAFSTDVTIQRLLGLAGSRPIGRAEAARTLVLATEVVDNDVLRSIALALTQDPDVDVRSIAAQVFPAVDGATPHRSLSAVARQRLLSLLMDSGSVVVHGACLGVAQARKRGIAIEDETMDVVKGLARNHPSARVRAAAANALTERN
jgi:hypothetical protein